MKFVIPICLFFFFSGYMTGCKQEKKKPLQKRMSSIKASTSALYYALNLKEKRSILKKVRSFLHSIPTGSEKRYGFANRSDFQRAKLGKSYPMATLLFRKGMVPTLKWLPTMRIAVVVEGNVKLWATLSFKNGVWRLANIGAIVLAKEFEELEGAVNADKAHKRALLRVYSLRSDFLLFYEKKKGVRKPLSVYPNRSARMFLSFPSQILPFASFLRMIRQKWQESRQKGKDNAVKP